MLFETYMLLLMSAQIATFSELLIANATLIGLLPCVPTHMDLQSARPHKGLITLITFEGPFACVPAHMIAQVTMSGECAAAVRHRALEWFLAKVDPHVCLQVAFFGEALTASLEVAYEWLFAEMGALMDLQAARARVTLAADVTLERFVASVDQLVSF